MRCTVLIEDFFTHSLLARFKINISSLRCTVLTEDFSHRTTAYAHHLFPVHICLSNTFSLESHHTRMRNHIHILVAIMIHKHMYKLLIMIYIIYEHIYVTAMISLCVRTNFVLFVFVFVLFSLKLLRSLYLGESVYVCMYQWVVCMCQSELCVYQWVNCVVCISDLVYQWAVCVCVSELCVYLYVEKERGVDGRTLHLDLCFY